MGLDPNYKSKEEGDTLIHRVLSNFMNAIPEAEIEKALKQIRDENKAAAEAEEG